MCHVLVVDDPQFQDLLSELFEDRGFDVAVAADGWEAISEIQRRLPDVIVSDISMPNLTGTHMFELLRGQGAHVPVILVTGMTSVLVHRANAIIRKPNVADDLLDQVGVVLKDRRAGDCAALCRLDAPL